jgi:hypothetical protein
MGWCCKSQSRIKLIMGKLTRRHILRTLPEKNICYVHKSDGAKLSTKGITLLITKRPVVSEQLSREELAELWSSLTIKSGGSLASKFFIPFGKEESTLGDAEMTHTIEQHSLFLQTTKQIIVRNLNDINEEKNLVVDNDINMD